MCGDYFVWLDEESFSTGFTLSLLSQNMMLVLVSKEASPYILSPGTTVYSKQDEKDTYKVLWFYRERKHVMLNMCQSLFKKKVKDI